MCVHTYTIYFVYPFIPWWIWACFCVWSIMNNTAENISARIFTQDSALIYLECIPRSGTVRWGIILFFLSNAILIALFYSSKPINKHSIFSHSYQYLTIFERFYLFILFYNRFLLVITYYLSMALILILIRKHSGLGWLVTQQ